MEFCPKCGMRLTPTRKEKGKKVTLQLLCNKCGFKKATQNASIAPKPLERTPQEPIAIIGKKEQKLRTLPTLKRECPKCGNNLAYVWQVQTRGGDEGSTQFFRCTKCNFTFREYG